MAGIPPLNSEVLSAVEKLAANLRFGPLLLKPSATSIVQCASKLSSVKSKRLLFTKKTVPGVWLN